jgi:aldose 1-epimerase
MVVFGLSAVIQSLSSRIPILTLHICSYFNLSGHPTIQDTRVTLSTNLHLPVSDDLVPLGDMISYPGVEANKEFILGEHEPDIDRCFICNNSPETVPIDTRSEPMRLLAQFAHPDSRVHLEVYSTEPAFQFYTGRYIDVPAVSGPDGGEIVPVRVPRAGFCVEPGRYINSVNVDAWKGMVLLKKGQVYGSRIRYRAWQQSSATHG